MEQTAQLQSILKQTIIDYIPTLGLKVSLSSRISVISYIIIFLILAVIIYIKLVSFFDVEYSIEKLVTSMFSAALSGVATVNTFGILSLITVPQPLPTEYELNTLVSNYKVEEISEEIKIPKLSKEVFQNDDGSLRLKYLPTDYGFGPSITVMQTEVIEKNGADNYTFSYKHYSLVGHLNDPSDKYKDIHEKLSDICQEAATSYIDTYLNKDAYIRVECSADPDALQPIIERTVYPIVNVQPSSSTSSEGIQLTDGTVFYVPDNIKYVQSNECKIRQVCELCLGESYEHSNLEIPDTTLYHYEPVETTVFYIPTSQPPTANVAPDVNVNVDVDVNATQPQ